MRRNYLKIIYSIIFILSIFIIWSINIYNNLIQFNEKTKTQWGQVENVYQRRSDLIPNLVNTVKGSANFEKETLNKIMEARAKATSIQINDLNQNQIDKFQKVQDNLSHSIGRLLLTVENYPDLKSQQNFYELQNQLEGTENRISVERNRYNKYVNYFNTYRNQFPRMIVSNLFSQFEEKGYFKSRHGSEITPIVNFAT